MLVSLTIKNFALIEALSMHFSNNFSVITGETGAGKSILLGALGLILGNRADLTSLKDKEQKCVVEVVFDISKYDLKSFFESNDLDYEDQTIIRREILPNGKSRAFINDSPVNLSELNELGYYLIDIHSQNQSDELSEATQQFKIIDILAQNNQLIEAYSKDLEVYNEYKNQLNEFVSQLDKASKEQDYNAFLLNELVEAKLIVGEQEELEDVLKFLTNVEYVKESLEKALAISEEDQIGVARNIKEIKQAIQKITSLSDNYANLFNRIQSVQIEFDDIVSELSRSLETLVHDPEKLEMSNQKLQVIYSLQKKHQVLTVEQLIEIREALEKKVSAVENSNEHIKKIENEIALLKEDLIQKSQVITKNRNKAIPILKEQLVRILGDLGMENARFDIQINTTQNFYKNGVDQIQFLFSANKGTHFGLLKKVASGGEMSRIMLAIKAILSSYSKLPTIIFDEIDTGVSGEIANKMGEIMKKMSSQMQVFAITHLPQIAGKGIEHYKVFKTIDTNTTKTELKLLNVEERIEEIAEMLSGKNISQSAIVHAKELLS
jgi:DNA repair protein RecN (Recombination protein N)